MGLLQPPVIGRLHRQRDQRLMIGEPGRLHVTEDRVLAVSDAGDPEHRCRALGAGAEVGEFAERAFGFAVGGVHQPLDDDFGMGGHLEVDGVARDHLDVFAEDAGGVFQFIEVLVLAAPVRHDLVDGMQADGECHGHRLPHLHILHVVGVVVPRRHPEGAFLRVVGDHHADDGLVAHTGLRVLGDGDPGPQIGTRVTVGMNRDRQLAEVHLLAQHLDFLHRSVFHHDRLAGAVGHLLGEMGADLVDVGNPQRRRLAKAVLDQDVGQSPAGKTLEIMEHQRSAALRTQDADLVDGVDLVMDVKDPVVDRFKKAAEAVRHIKSAPEGGPGSIPQG